MHARHARLLSGAFVFAVATLSCSGPTGPTGPAGQEGPAGPQGPPGPGATSSSSGGGDAGGTFCTPRAWFCDGNAMAICTRSGADAFDIGTCTGTGTNPQKCTTAGCSARMNGPGGGQGACCQSTKPLVDWMLTAPSAYQGSFTGIEADVDQFNGPDPCTQSSTFSFQLQASEGTCPAKQFQVQVSFHRSAVAVGQTLTFTNQTQPAQFNFNSSDGSCSYWTGTLKFDSDAPNWQVEVNLTCAQGGGSLSAPVTGTFSGTT